MSKYKICFSTAHLCLGLLLAGCVSQEERLRQRAAELCQYIPDHELLEQSKDYMTADFYAVLDTLFNLPEHEAVALLFRDRQRRHDSGL